MIGLPSGAMLFVHAFIAAALHASSSCGSPRVERLLRPCHRLHECIFANTDEDGGCACCRIFQLYLAVLMVPMFFAGRCEQAIWRV